jgi:predicted nucleic acid-binding protein
MILVDTSVLISFLKGIDNKPTRKFKRMLKQKVPFGITSCIYQEILQGAKSEQEYALLKTYFETQHFIHPLHPVETFAQAAGIYVECRKKGITIRSSIDCLIAQIAIEHDLLLLHNDSDLAAIARVVSLKFY